MFTFGSAVSLQPHQIFLPFSHVASVLTGARSSGIGKVRKGTAHSTHAAEKQECDTSLIRAVKNCQDSVVHELCKRRIWEHLDLAAAEARSTARLIASSDHPSSMPWIVSHVSSKSFFENKHGFPESQLLKRSFFSRSSLLSTRPSLHCGYANLLSVHTTASKFNRYLQSRGFKIRSQRIPIGITGGQPPQPLEATTIGERFLGLGIKKDKDKLKLTSGAHQNERLKALMSDENLTAEEQQRLRVAFAEGYIAADPKTRVGSKMRFFNFFRDLLSIILILGIFVSLMGELSGGPFRRVLIGTTNEVHPEEIEVTFEDVKGVDEAKQELQEIVEFLRNPEKFSVLGGKLPKGVLLVGPPGTGKTLLARAVAGEANVPFFHAAGPEFDEILVGQGARRVRDLFNTAKLRAPCVIFIDEIDSVGAKRTNSVLHPYANQTINQLLTEMDGFRQNEGVIVLGATNRRDDLDKALLRPGRFDVEVQVPVPDLGGRKEILNLYLGKVKLSTDVDMDVLGRGTTGFTGADLENIVNQAALRAAIDGAEAVSMFYLENARDKILMGPERKSRIPDDEANGITAYHEGGHALVAFYTKEAHPLHKVTIIPRGPSLGHTAYIPEKEQYHVTRAQMLATMDTLMGGRAAEEIIFGAEKITSGAASDLKQATALATHMVKDLGMSDKVGVRTFDDEHNSLVVVNDLAASTSELIDSEIKRLLGESYERAKTILRNHSREHKLIAEALLIYETLDVEDIKSILSGKDAIRKRPV